MTIARNAMLSRSHKRIPVGCLISLVGSLAALCSGAAAGDKVLSDEWYAMYLGDQRVGYQHAQTLETTTDGRTAYRTSYSQELRIARAGQGLALQLDNAVVEDEAGRLISFRRRLRQGPLEQVTTGRVDGDVLMIETGSGEGKLSRAVPAPEGLCPWAADRLTQEMGYHPRTSYSFQAFIPDIPELYPEISVLVRGQERKKVFEITKWLHRVELEISVLPGVKVIEWVDSEGVMWLSEAVIGGMYRFEVRKVSKAAALVPGDAAEVFLRSSVPADREIPDPRRVSRVKLLVSRAEGDPGDVDIPESAYQEVKRTPRGALLSIRRAGAVPGGGYELPYQGEEYRDLLRPGPWMETQDPLIVSMSEEAVGGEKDAARAARRIESYVSERITTKDLSLGFATALETARQKAGDCSEHAVLVTALARAAGMPARVVVGLVYLAYPRGDGEGRFFYHMWSEAYVGEWLPLDAAFGSHDATHIELGRSALNRSSDMLEVSTAVLKLLGAFKIEVLEPGGEQKER